MLSYRLVLLPLACSLLSFPGYAQSTQLGLFSGQNDIGTILHPGDARFDPAQQTYTVSGSGDNTWFKADDLHYVWKKVDGDVTLSSEISFIGATGNAHRKAMLMIRQGLDADSAYVDVARHGDGLTSLQYRNATGDVTREIELHVEGPSRVRIEKHGEFFYVSYAQGQGKWQYSGAAMHLPMHGSFYIGLAVCSHDKDVVEKAAFSHVQVDSNPASAQPALYSTLEVVPIASTDRRIVYTAPAHFEAPNWLRDNSGYLVNQDGHLEKISSTGEGPTSINTNAQVHCNNDHGVSPDGTHLAVSDTTDPGGSRIYTHPLAGGPSQRITENAPSYWHGWSLDGKTIVFTGQRNGDFDIYTIPATGGSETRLTTSKGTDDGPEYSPDGQYIYFNSERTGHMQIWRMHPDGSAQEQVTHDQTSDWFPHISPDGKWMVFVAYEPGVTGHPANHDVTLRLMSLATNKVTLLAKLFGGQGTINVPSWSPDSTRVAFVSYEMLPHAEADE
jgi:dipeptidyl aminopeptidase/acylaminoacyl peptidase